MTQNISILSNDVNSSVNNISAIPTVHNNTASQPPSSGNSSHTSNPLGIFHININRLRTKTADLEDVLTLHPVIDVICICEHKVPDPDEIRYHTVRNFTLADFYCRGAGKPYGGVLIYIKKSITYRKLNIPSHLKVGSKFEICGIGIPTYDLAIFSVYRVPGADMEVFSATISLAAVNYSKIAVASDFNINIFDPDHQDTMELFSLMDTFQLIPTHYQQTRYAVDNRCIDNILVSDTLEFDTCTVSRVHSDHIGLLTTLNISRRTDGTASFKSFRKLNNTEAIRELASRLLQVEWKETLSGLPNAQSSFDYFWTLFMRHFEELFPLQKKKKTYRPRVSLPITEELKNLRNEYRHLLELRSTSCRNEPWLKQALKINKKQYHTMLVQNNIKQNNKKIESSSNYSKACWKIVNESRVLDDTTLVSKISPEVFNDIFIDKPKSLVNNIRDSFNMERAMGYLNPSSRSRNNFELEPVNEREVFKIVMKMNNSSAVDFYGMHVPFIKSFASVLCIPLTVVINISFSEGHFPSQLKYARVVPVFKKGKRDDPENYRPISITPILSKVYEIAFRHRLLLFLKTNNILSPHQFGFREGLCTYDLLDKLLTVINSALDKSMSTHLNLLDLSRSFETVNHALLLKKLEFYGIRGKSLKFLSDYLQGRFQTVEWGGDFSPLRDIDCGVIQGSVNGPFQ